MSDYTPEDSGDFTPWDSEEALESLKMERSVMGDHETHEQTTRRILAEASPLAASRIVHLALHSANDNTSLAASRYITDTAINADADNGKALWEKMLGEAVSEVELHANSTTPGE